jgi:hypothetical protein
MIDHKGYPQLLGVPGQNAGCFSYPLLFRLVG